MKIAVVGGGLAGCVAALELARDGHDVTLYEARPTLGGAVQTLPARAGDPSPPPDNGQHIALACFTEYLSFLDEIGESSSYERRPLELPVVGEDGAVAVIRPTLRSLLGYRHLPLGERVRLVRTLRALEQRDVEPPLDAITFGELLRSLGASSAQIDRFWDVFLRPALNLRSDEVAAAPALFTVKTALLGARGAGDLILPRRPLGAMHGEAAARALVAAGAELRTEERVASVDELDADGVVVALPPAEAAEVLGERAPRLDDSPIVSVHLLFDRPILRSPLAALLCSDAHWVFDRGALIGEAAGGHQYLTVVSSGVPELMEIRGRALVERIASQVTVRLGRAELLWSRVSREPRATIALRPGTGDRRRPAVTRRPNVVLAGAWTQTGWPVTMESAVRSGREAARLLSEVTTKAAA